MTAQPREPTPEMIDAALAAQVSVHKFMTGAHMTAIWRAMYDAAPAQPVAQPAEPPAYDESVPPIWEQLVAIAKDGAEPPANVAEIVAAIRNPYSLPKALANDRRLEAADLIERQAREIAELRRALDTLGKMPTANMERAERAEPERDALRAENIKLRGWVNDAEQAAGREQRRADALAGTLPLLNTRAESAEAERDALRELLREVLHATSSNMSMDMYAKVCAALDAARAKVGKP